MSDFQVSSELLGIYLEDARGHLEALDNCLLSLERDGFDSAVVSNVLGPLHTLKGNSGMIGFAAIKDYVHKLEDVFVSMADAAVEPEAKVFDELLSGAAALRDAIERAAEARAEVLDLKSERASLERLLRSDSAATAAGPERPAPSQPAPAQPARPQPQAQARADVAQYVTARSSTVRVDFTQLDNLLNLVGELIIHRTKLEQAGRELAEQLGGQGDAARQLLETVQHVSGVSTSLQERVMDIRMLPIRHVFDRFPRLVRDLARQQGKEIELILEGEATRVDKAIIDEIGEPLVHMIRNSVDHGIETPETREARGKTRTGTILLSASQESNHVIVTIMDDGRGIDAEAVRRKAVERGLLKGDEHLTDREAIQLIFSQGFSTAAAITEVSGRGVGLEVVLQSIERLNGLVEVESVPKVGTKFIIQLPLTLAIISALLIDVSGQTYAVPLSAVVESIKFGTEAICRINGRDTLRIRDRVVPLLRLSQIFGLEERAAPERQYAVILGRGDKRVGLVVDHLRGQQSVVIKALDPAVSGGAYGVAGATIMGDGRVVLILDVATLFEGKRFGLVHGREEAVALRGS